LLRELEGLYEKYASVIVKVVNGLLQVSITHIQNNQKQVFDFQLSQDYPFKAPTIWFQKKPYFEFLKISYSDKMQQKMVKLLTGQLCFCCGSYNCFNNWSPSVTLQKIIHEIQQIKQHKRNIINKLLADKIKFKYLIQDIDLDSWLFSTNGSL
jgi:ubiquitin-protein ligase